MPGAGRVDPNDFALHTTHSCCGCPGCSSHVSKGPPLLGSTSVKINGKPALRQGMQDGGTHASGTCCGTNKWFCVSSQPKDRGVKINGKLAFCKTDETQHCGKPGGKLMLGSTNVFVGGRG